jgi:predicted porin
MKKLLIATAALAMVTGSVQAQSSVTVYGLLDLGVTDINTSTSVLSTGLTTGTNALNTGNSGRLSGTRLGFRGAEDLGGGLKANFTFETGVDITEQGNGIGNGTRLGFVELASNNLGSLSLGRQLSSTKFVNDAFTVFGNPSFVTGFITGSAFVSTTAVSTTGAYTVASLASTQGTLNNANGGERISNLVRYTTPTFNGVTLTAGGYKNYNDGSRTAAIIIGDENGQGMDAGARYTSGKLAMAAAYNRYETTDGLTGNVFSVDNAHKAFGISYDFGVAKLFANHNSREYSTTSLKIRFIDTNAGVSVPLGQTVLMASYSDGKDSSTSSSTDKSGYQIGAVHNLSKRTNVYAVYGDGELSSTNGTNSKITQSGVAIGVRHSF